MAKPVFSAGYSEATTHSCERVLVTLLRGLGPWADTVYLVGGLTPRYLVKGSPRAPHAGTADVDIVVDLAMLADTRAYRTLEENLKRLKFERGTNEKGDRLSWRWQRKVGDAMLVLEFLADDPALGGGKVQELPTEGGVSALNIPHAVMVLDFHDTVVIRAELLDEEGIYDAKIKHADIVSFTCLKAFAFGDRAERKDAHDLVYCLEHHDAGGPESAAKLFVSRLDSGHREAMHKALDILRSRFTTVGGGEGYRRDGPVAVAVFELGDDITAELRERRVLRQREAADVITRFLGVIDAGREAPSAE
jgi:hypothetical protein